MSIEVSCQGCRKRYTVPESAAGKKLRCKACGATIVVPADEIDPFDDSDALMAMEQSATPEPAPYLPPLPKPRTTISSKTILLISAAAGGLVAIVAVVLLIVHFTGSQPKTQSAGSTGKNASADAPQGGVVGTTLEERLTEIWNLLNQYAATHGGRYPAAFADAGHPELASGIDHKRGINFDLAVSRLDFCKSPLPAKMMVAAALGSRDASGNLTNVVLFGDGQIQTLDQQAYQKARQESDKVQVDARLWLASDTSTPRGTVVAWFVAMGMGNAQAVRNLACKVDEQFLEGMADQKAASREFVSAGVARFPSVNHAEPRPPKTETDLARQILNIVRGGPENITGDTAVLGERNPFVLTKIDGTWRLDVRPMFNNPTPLQYQLANFIIRINARATREVTQEISQGKFADWPAAKQALLDRMRKLAAADDAFQALAQAHRSEPLPSFAMVDSWSIQQDPPEPIADAPAPPVQATVTNPAPVVHAENVTPPNATNNAATTAPGPVITSILPDPNDKPEPLRTEIAGGKGGGPIETRSPNDTSILGFHYALGHWGNQAVVQRFEPIFQGAAEKPADDKIKTLIARNGYVVGGLIVDYDDTNVIAVRVIFARKTGEKIDAKDQYRSEWIGTPAGKHQQQLAGKGETIIGTFGRQGLNVGALGLLMPSNLRKTALLGGKGGGPFTSAGNGEKLVVGFRYSPGNWNGPVIGHFYPLYDPAGNDPPSPDQDLKTAKTILARDGYAVGGLIADFDDINFFAFRVIFLRQKAGQLDPKDQYTSDWIGMPKGKSQQQLAGNGETIVGIFGRQGMNCDAIGLLEKLPQAPAASNPTQPR